MLCHCVKFQCMKIIVEFLQRNDVNDEQCSICSLTLPIPGILLEKVNQVLYTVSLVISVNVILCVLLVMK